MNKDRYESYKWQTKQVASEAFEYAYRTRQENRKRNRLMKKFVAKVQMMGERYKKWWDHLDNKQKDEIFNQREWHIIISRTTSRKMTEEMYIKSCFQNEKYMSASLQRKLKLDEILG